MLNEILQIETVAKIFASVFAETVLHISPLIHKGAVNQVFVIQTKNSKFILRINAADSLDEYEKEVWASGRAFKRGVFVPAILKIRVFEEKAFSIQAFIEGTEGRNLAGDKSFVWKKLGEYASRIHQIKTVGFGLNFQNLTAGNAQKSWLEYLEYNIESLHETDELRKLGVLSAAQSENVTEIFENLRWQKFVFGLNHGDLSLKNTIIDDSGIIHLIDWGSAEASIVPHHDLIQLLKMNLLENDPNDTEIRTFLDGYGITSGEYKTMLPDLKALSLLRTLDKLRWAIDWKIVNLEDYIYEAKATIKKFL